MCEGVAPSLSYSVLTLREPVSFQLETEYDRDGATPSHMRYGYVHPSVTTFPHEVFA